MTTQPSAGWGHSGPAPGLSLWGGVRVLPCPSHPQPSPRREPRLVPSRGEYLPVRTYCVSGGILGGGLWR